MSATGQVDKRSYDQEFPFEEPSPTIQKYGLADQRPSSIRIVDDGKPEAEQAAVEGKPRYRVPLVSEIQAMPKTGLKVMSTFSGCGGSCLGFEWAGYTPLLAVEFVASAVESYRANHPGVPVFTDDIRTLTAAEALRLMGIKRGELDVLEGSPPCESFSTAGIRSKGWGQTRSYSDGKNQVMDDLFFEFTRLLGGIKPRAFVAENVSGLVKGSAKGYFIRIHKELEAQGYRVQARMLDAQWLGVPQRRQRVIFVGVRRGLRLDPVFPDPLPYRYSIRDALADLGAGPERLVYENGGLGGASADGLPEEDLDAPIRAITKSHGVDGHFRVDRVKYDNGGWSRHDVDLDGPMRTVTKAHGEAGHFRVDRGEPGEIIGLAGGWPHRAMSVDEPVATIGKGGLTAGSIQAHEVKRAGDPVRDGQPLKHDYPDRWESLAPGEHDPDHHDLVRSDPDAPVDTITRIGGASHRSAATHPDDPRKFSIPELRRLCGFPDDFELAGSYAQQWERLGNSVPPPMMFHVAAALRDGVLLPRP